MKQLLYAAGLVTLMLTAMWSVAADKMTEEQERKPVTNRTSIDLTPSMFDSIKEGMSPEEVTAIIGCKEFQRTESIGTFDKSKSQLILLWLQPNTDFIKATFRQGKLDYALRSERL